MLLAVKKNSSNLFDIRLAEGRMAGALVATAERVVYRTKGRKGCTLQRVWGLQILDERVFDIPGLSRNLGLCARIV